jgi:hypothetical protein
MVYLLGLIGAAARRDLHLMRKVRNVFGHSAKPLSFSEPSISSQCREMGHSNLGADAKPRQKFTNSVLGVTAMIHGAIRETKHAAKALDVVFEAPFLAASRDLAKRLAKEIIRNSTTTVKKPPKNGRKNLNMIARPRLRKVKPR